jgi:hypothetical protein
MVGTSTRLSRRKWWLTNMTIWDAPPELAAHTIHKPTTTLHRHYRSKHGTIFEVSVNPQSQQHAILQWMKNWDLSMWMFIWWIGMWIRWMWIIHPNKICCGSVENTFSIEWWIIYSFVYLDAEWRWMKMDPIHRFHIQKILTWMK